MKQASIATYSRLARLLPADLRLVDDAEASRSVTLLTLAASRRVLPRDIDPVDVFYREGGADSLTAGERRTVEDLLAQDKDALATARAAVACNDFGIPAVPAYGATRVSSKMLTAMGAIHDMFCLSAYWSIYQHQHVSAQESIGDLYRLSGMFCSAAGDFSLYALGSLGLTKAMGLMNRLLGVCLATIDMKGMELALPRDDRLVNGYLSAILSDFLRDIVLTFAELDASIRSPARRKAIPTRMLWAALTRMRSSMMAAMGHHESPLPRAKTRAIVGAATNSQTVVDLERTLSCLARNYESFRDAFQRDMGARMGLENPEADQSSVWPEELQLTAQDALVPSRVLVSEAARRLASIPNALGLLVLRDIVRAVNAAVDRLLALLWRPLLDLDATRLMLAVVRFERSCGRRPDSAEEALGDGAMFGASVDRLTGVRLKFMPARHVIVGPSFETVSARIAYLPDAFPLEWPVPQVCSH